MGLKNVNLGSLIIASVFLMWFYLHFRNINYILSGYCSEEPSLIVWCLCTQPDNHKSHEGLNCHANFDHIVLDCLNAYRLLVGWDCPHK